MGKQRRRGKVVVFPYPERAELRGDVLLPEEDDDTVVVRTIYSGISRGTEMDLYHAEFHGKRQWYPMLPGYEPVGEVIEIGRNVSHVKSGDRVIVGAIPLGYEERLCVAWGGQTEYCIVNCKSVPNWGIYNTLGPNMVRKIPDNISYEEAVFFSLGGVAYHGIEKVGVSESDTVVIIGQGVVGMMGAQICRAKGARVIVSDLCDYRLNISRQVGIKEVINTQKEKQKERVGELTEDKGPDVVIETTGEPENLLMALDMVKEDGKVHAQGMYLKPISLYIPDTLFAKNLSLSSTVDGSPEHREDILRLISTGQINVKPMISKVMNIDEVTEAYELVDHKPDEFVKILLRWK